VEKIFWVTEIKANQMYLCSALHNTHGFKAVANIMMLMFCNFLMSLLIVAFIKLALDENI